MRDQQVPGEVMLFPMSESADKMTESIFKPSAHACHTMPSCLSSNTESLRVT